MSITISSTIERYPKSLPYKRIAETILGKQYDISLTFVGRTRAKTLNQTYRHKDYVPNVLSFPLSDQVGEIFICPEVTKHEAKQFYLSPNGYIGYLFIHGCLHLKGIDHGAKMDKLETKYLKQFRLT